MTGMDGNRASTAGGPPPGPEGPPLVGSTFQFVSDPFRFYDRCREAYDSDVVSYVVAGRRAYMLLHPADVERVLVTDAPDFRKGQVLAESLGRLAPNGLVVTEGEQWQRDRTLLQPLFYRKRVEAYADTMTAYAAATVDGWTPGEPVALPTQMKTLTLRVLAKTLLDVDLEGRMDEIADATARIVDRFDSRNLTAFLPLWLPTLRNYRAKRALGDFHDLVDDLVAERRRELGDPAAVDPAAVERDDLLTLLLTAEYEDGTRMDDETVRDQLLTFLVAGHETTALTLTYALFLLANHPDEQERLRAELDAELDGDPGATDLGRLPSLDWVVSETLRLYPPAFVIFREPECDITIQGYEIPEGSILSLPQWNVHRDGRWWDEPEEFRPERWVEGEGEGEVEGEGRPEYAYFPFGGGPRHCIGMRFARMEAKLALATILSRYRVEPGSTPPLDLRMALTLQPDQPISVVPREV